MLKKAFFKIAAIDRLISIKIHHATGRKPVDWLMFWLSRLGDGHFYIALTILLFLINMETGLDFVSAAFVAFSVELLLYKIIKNTTRRVRPFERLPMIKFLIKPPDQFSFPSGHTAAAFVMATLISGFYHAFMIPGYFLAALVGFSRIYNGVHYPSDVLVGMLLGYSSAKFGLSFIF